MQVQRSPHRFALESILLFLLVAGLPLFGHTASGARLAILLSQDAPQYQQAKEGFRHHLSQQSNIEQIVEYNLAGDSTKAAQILPEIRSQNPRLIITVGSLATQTTLRAVNDIPVVACMVLNSTELRQVPNATGVVLDFPVEIQFEWLRRLLPGSKTVGVLFNPKENLQKIATATKVAQEYGLTLVAREVATPLALPEALDSLAKEAEVLWGITDQTVLSPQTAEPILLFSFRNRIPFAGLSASWVKAGALYALDRDYVDLGTQCGELAIKILNGTPPQALPLVTPRKVTYALNLKTAQHMKLEIPPTLVTQAQQVFK